MLPEWAVAHSPGRDPDAVGQAWPGQPRATVAAADVLRTATGAWVVTADHLRVPAGLGYALAARDTVARAAPGLFAAAAGGLDPGDAVPLLRAGLAAAAPPACRGAPQVAVLTSGESDNAWFEHRLLADALGVPAGPGRGPLAAHGRRRRGRGRTASGIPVDVLYRRFDDGLLAAFRTPDRASRWTRCSPRPSGPAGSAWPTSRATGSPTTSPAYAWVPEMIRFYLGEEPLLGSVPTWVLADDEQWAQVRDRLHELVVDAGRRVRRPGRPWSGRRARPPSSPFLQAEVVGGALPLRRAGAGGADDAADPRGRRACGRGTSTCGCSRWPDRAAGRPRPARAADPGRGRAAAGELVGPAARRTPGSRPTPPLGHAVAVHRPVSGLRDHHRRALRAGRRGDLADRAHQRRAAAAVHARHPLAPLAVVAHRDRAPGRRRRRRVTSKNGSRRVLGVLDGVGRRLARGQQQVVGLVLVDAGVLQPAAQPAAQHRDRRRARRAAATPRPAPASAGSCGRRRGGRTAARPRGTAAAAAARGGRRPAPGAAARRGRRQRPRTRGPAGGALEDHPHPGDAARRPGTAWRGSRRRRPRGPRPTPPARPGRSA